MHRSRFCSAVQCTAVRPAYFLPSDTARGCLDAVVSSSNPLSVSTDLECNVSFASQRCAIVELSGLRCCQRVTEVLRIQDKTWEHITHTHFGIRLHINAYLLFQFSPSGLAADGSCCYCRRLRLPLAGILRADSTATN